MPRSFAWFLAAFPLSDLVLFDELLDADLARRFLRPFLPSRSSLDPRGVFLSWRRRGAASAIVTLLPSQIDADMIILAPAVTPAAAMPRAATIGMVSAVVRVRKAAQGRSRVAPEACVSAGKKPSPLLLAAFAEVPRSASCSNAATSSDALAPGACALTAAVLIAVSSRRLPHTAPMGTPGAPVTAGPDDGALGGASSTSGIARGP